ncbi:UDP-3-O-(3-hydroxymyristoyl)glucosamine N-acyltransferase [Chelatococcus composti]|mgnify:CR=1 FL=1|jgi:UDP-3-O-[3-hydroxymyristoyl] glucosamine N-acyltransferase|uniref:UDP-3-O-acylglucosamine N-acyltransferase n=1 Tax=Chelatococcus composti TaxID=1743235 RepID=A0A841K3V9_9HYPH|nr:UDP-3-O-(3-hydroxymyristoyl)glucosamine N-acyltransferase [Chelatococcus composti]MBB6166995.1 UDP-3-O-[3-hydroxymyristoyl] glucosamine N-acyltransferase [Chelatococcus composti]MBS7737104.1 UDP-3-O-(3-hydroxymyristoyl)glucosamine N-acyltransferase [Chelatococcus composti]GGG24259.1 UDP-3-O-acylglucosamine N-acyltransferase [Chelatococcus composti]
MSDPVFFVQAARPTLAEVASLTGAELPASADPQMEITGISPLESAGEGDLAYMDNPRYADALSATRASACLVSRRFAARVPAGCVALVVPEPYRAFAKVLTLMYPAAARPGSQFGADGVSPGAYVHPQARLETGVIVDPGASIGPGAEIGSGTVISSNAVVGPGVRIGRNCSIGPGVVVQHALIGNRVILHAGAKIGQDGFGFAMGAEGHYKVPQIGRVIIQDDVEIGANTTVDRGASRDTVIGEGTKIDNLVQIGHNVVIGRHCVIVSQVGIAGSATLEDFVVLGGQVGVVGHVRIGMGAQIAASSNVATDVPPGVKWGGSPAKPMRAWLRELMTLKDLAARRGDAGER